MRHLVIAAIVLALAMAGCGDGQKAGDRKEKPPISVEFHAASDGPQPGYLTMNLDRTTRTYHVDPRVVLSLDAITSAEVDTVDRQHPAVVVTLTEAGASTFNAWTRERVGKRVAVVVDGLLVSVPMVMQEITGNRAVIDGRFDLEEARRIAHKINGR